MKRREKTQKSAKIYWGGNDEKGKKQYARCKTKERSVTKVNVGSLINDS